MQKGDKGLIKATRLERTLIPISFILLAAAFANEINFYIFILIICCVTTYCIGGLVNAWADKDFETKHLKMAIGLLFFTSIVLSVFNYIIFISVLLWFVLGYIYSKHSRKILLGDSVMLSLTHAVIPVFSTMFVLDKFSFITIKLGMLVFLAMNLMIPMKNFNGISEDKDRGYKTLMTSSKKGSFITQSLANLYYISMLLFYFVFHLRKSFLILFFVAGLILFFVNYLISRKAEILAYKLTRFFVLIFAFIIVFSSTTKYVIIIASASLLIFYTVYLILELDNL